MFFLNSANLARNVKDYREIPEAAIRESGGYVVGRFAVKCRYSRVENRIGTPGMYGAYSSIAALTVAISPITRGSVAILGFEYRK